jgi:hypothetical protein
MHADILWSHTQAEDRVRMLDGLTLNTIADCLVSQGANASW